MTSLGRLLNKRGLSRAAVAAGLLAIAAPALASSPPTAKDQELRLATIGYKLSVANANMCAKHQHLTGLLLHELGQYDQPDRAGVARSFALGDGFGILNVVPGSAAERAGLRRGDEIVAVNGRDVRAAFPAFTGRAGSYARMEAFNGYLEAALSGGPAEVAIKRGGTESTTRLTGQAGCGGGMVLTHSGALNAWSDGKSVAITTRLADFASSDDELAFVVAHEMSHNILEHSAKLGLTGNSLFDSLSPNVFRIKSTEIEADRYAIGLMHNAGFDLRGASSFLTHSAKLRWMDLPLTHPSISRRLRIVASAEERLKLGPVRGQSPVTVAGAATEEKASAGLS